MSGYILIRGTKEQLLSAANISGLLIRPRTSQQIEANVWEVNAYASNDAITELENLGAFVVDLVSQETIETHLASLDDYIGEDSNGPLVS
jgi:hypothetical protein